MGDEKKNASMGVLGDAADVADVMDRRIATKRVLDVCALGGAMAGSVLIASNIGFNDIGYMFFLLSSVSSVILLSRSNASKSLLFTNLFFTVMNVIGIIRY